MSHRPAERSKERLLLLFDEHVQGDRVNFELFKQLQAKDNVIELLNERLHTAATLAKNTDSLFAKDKRIQTLLEEKATQAESLRTAQAEYLELIEKQYILEERLKREKAELNLQNVNLTNECEAQKEKMHDQTEQLQKASSDSDHMLKKSQEFSKRIKTLEEEVKRKTQDCEAAIYQVAQMEETERELVQAQSKLQAKYYEEAGAALNLPEPQKEVNRLLGEVREKISVEASIETLAKLDELANKIKSLADKQANLMRGYIDFKGKYQAADEETASQQKQVNSLLSENKRLSKALDEKDELCKELQRELDKAFDDEKKLQNHTKELQQQVKKLQFSEKIKQKQLDSLQELTKQLKEWLEAQQRDNKATRQETWKLRLEHLELKAKYETLQETSFKSEQRASAAQNKLDALIDELWIRDNDLLRKETQRLKLQEDCNRLKTSLQSLEARLKHQTENPLKHLGVCAQVLMTWPWPFLPALRQASEASIEELPSPVDLESAAASLMQTWTEERQRTEPSVLHCLMREYGALYLKYSALFLLVAAGQLGVALSLSWLTQGLQRHNSCWLAAAYVGFSFVTICCLNQGYFRGQVLGSLVRHSLVAMLLRKLTTLPCEKQREALVLTLVGAELDVLEQLSCTPFLVVTPCYVALALPVLWHLLGVAGLAGVLGVVLIYPLKAMSLRFLARLRTSVLQLKEQRVSAVRELVEGIRTAKLYGWEESLGSAVEQLKGQEQRHYQQANGLLVVSSTFLVSGGALVLLLTVASLVGCGQPLEAGRLFGALSVLLVMNNLVHGITNGGIDVAVYLTQALRKVTQLLCLPERVDVRIPGPLELANVSAAWRRDQAVLSDVSFSLQPGELCLVLGPVGAGKSSLLAVMAGELAPHSGTVSISKSVAYVSQEAWVAAGTIKSNIALGQEIDEKRYQQVLQACALEPDLKTMKAGDLTQVGERGAALSGGQKARLALARAAYRPKSVYLLDDPLSGLDAKVSWQVFKSCVLQLLAGTTRVLVTSNRSLLPYADKVLLLRDGKVENFGSSTLAVPPWTQSISEDLPPSIEVAEEEEIAESVGLDAYWRYIRLHFKGSSVLALLLLVVCVQVAYLSPSFWVAYWASQKDQVPAFYLWVLLALTLSLFALAVARNGCLYRGLCLCNERLHNLALRGVHGTDLAFFDRTASGQVVARFSKDVAVLEEQLLGSFADFIQVFAVLLSYLIALVLLNPVVLPCVLLLGWALRRVTSAYLPSARKLKRQELAAKARVVAQTATFLDGLSTTRCLGVLTGQLRTLQTALEYSFKVQFYSFAHLRSLQVYVDYLCLLFIAANTVAAVLDGGRADLQAVGFSFTVVVISYLGWFTDICTCLGNHIISAHRLFAYAALPPEDTAHLTTPLEVSYGALTFSDVSLRYAPLLPLALQNVSFEVPAGAHVGVVGRTGAGKSSLVVCLLRLRPITSGAVLIDGQNIANASLKDLRSKVTVIPQMPVLFSGTVRYNADPTGLHTMKEVDTALTTVGLVPSHEALKLSCGQKQLLCLARALLRNSMIVVSDEATGSLDQATESHLQTVLDQVLVGRTRLAIAHRLSYVLRCQLVVVMQAGRCVEIGSPQSLRAQSNSHLAALLLAAESQT